MSIEMPKEVSRKTKRVRRNYQKEMERLIQYCEIKKQVLESFNIEMRPDSIVGQIEAYKDVIAKANGK